jgi:sugar lactone lactonase YvrE
MVSVVGRSRVIVRAMVMLLVAAVVTVAQSAGAASRPKVIPLPVGFQPEGIATTNGDDFFTGSLVDGAIFKGSLRSGDGDIFVPGESGRVAVGLSVRRKMLFVAGGPTGDAYVYNTRTGEELGLFDLTDAESTFVNDVIATRDAAWFTDSFNKQLYKVPIKSGGRFGSPEVLPLTGDIVFVPGEFNANGIEATRNGKRLIVVQSNTGQLFEVHPRTGEATTIDLGGESVPSGDGILLDGGHRLWVLQNSINTLTLVDLESDLESGRVVSRTTDEDFDVPTTVAESGNRLAVVNARFGVPEPDTEEYWVTQIRKPR